MSHCPYCLVLLREITSTVDITGEDLPEDLWEERTFGKLQESHDTFSSVYNSNKKLAKNCNSTVEVSLLKEEVGVKVLDKCPPDELHELMGFLNHCYWDGYVKVMGGIKEALRFPQKLNVVSKDYHGKLFEGNACRTMIKQAHRMLDNDKDVLGDVSPIYVQPYVRAYQAMDKIVHKCFGTRVVDEDEVVISSKSL